MLTAEQFREQVDGFLERTGTKPSAFGRNVLGDPNFVSDLRKGRKPNLSVVGKVLSAINEACTASSGDTASHVGGSSPHPIHESAQAPANDADAASAGRARVAEPASLKGLHLSGERSRVS